MGTPQSQHLSPSRLRSDRIWRFVLPLIRLLYRHGRAASTPAALFVCDRDVARLAQRFQVVQMMVAARAVSAPSSGNDVVHFELHLAV